MAGTARRLLTSLADPFVRRALRSSRPTRLGRSLMLLTVRGRRTGHEMTFPVQYARDAGTIWVFPGDAERKTWWRNLREAAPVRLHLLGADLDGIGQAISGDSDPEEATRGFGVFLRRFPAAARGLGLEKSAGAEAIRAAVQHRVIVRIQGVQENRP
ncbi:MAG: nitroreductase family deazaflavin-dependent oxidoreductase [Actinobacteria bacterium]|nr:nitroreductase family deazaflavin-dependent oxidoreductase [Actinomycetota bacterium]